MPAMETEIPSPRSEPVSETVMPERLLSETGAAVFTERLGMRVFLGMLLGVRCQTPHASSWQRIGSGAELAFHL